jgi:hypothetical protein
VLSLNVVEFWRLAPLCLMWCIWRERNAKGFEDRETLLVELKILCSNLYTHG